MRVIAGSAKGIKLETRDGLGTRPTLERVKEAVFGSLQFEIKGAKCLDLFAGSGGMGIEALSRGAESCVFVDSDRNCVNIIRANLEKTKLSGRVMEATFEKALLNLEGSFDYVFMDPPYASGYYYKAAEIIKERRLLAKNGAVIAEHDGTLNEIDGYAFYKTRKYGKVFVTWLREKEENI